jgi:hypothetical protein
MSASEMTMGSVMTAAVEPVTANHPPVVAVPRELPAYLITTVVPRSSRASESRNKVGQTIALSDAPANGTFGYNGLLGSYDPGRTMPAS